jgi:hypothetical protein
MTHAIPIKPFRPRVTHPGITQAKHYLHLTFISGPKVLLTSHISIKCAALMGIMCMPSLLFSFILTIPSIIFQSPQQQAYFYFSKVLEADPSRWIVLGLAGLCALMSLAIPATAPQPNNPFDL